MAKAIKISDDNYIWLLKLAAELQKERGRVVSFDETLVEIRKGKKMKLTRLAGSWKMSDSEAKKLINSLYGERKISSRRL